MAIEEQVFPSDQAPPRPYADLAEYEDLRAPSPAPAGRHINWGQVAKGAAIITAVVLVGVVAMSVGGPLVTSGLTALNGIPVVGPVIAWTANTLAWTGAFLVHSAIAGASAVWTGLVGLFAGAPVLAAPQIHAAGTATGAIIGGGAVVASLPLASKAAAGLHFFDPNTPHMATPGMGDGSTAALLSGKKAATVSTINNTTNVDMTSDHGTIEAHSASTTAKISHHVGEGDHEHRGAAWLHRVTSSSAFKQTLANGGSYQDALTASQAASAGVQARNSNFSEQLNADRVALEAALKDPSRT